MSTVAALPAIFCVLGVHFVTAFLNTATSAEIPVGLKPYADRFDQDCAALDAFRESQLKTPRERYRDALAKAQKTAGAAGKTTELAAVTAELEALSSGELDESTPANLPHQLVPDRRSYLVAASNVARGLPPRQREVAAKYLRALAALEASALKSMDAEMTDAVANEKMRAVALIEAASGKANRNAIPNGSFSDGETGAPPEGWRAESADTPVTDAALVTEGMERYLRFRRQFVQKQSDLVLGEQVAIPSSAKTMHFSVRIRAKGLAASGKANNLNPGVHFIARDGKDEEVGDVWASAKQDGSWRRFSGRMELPYRARTLRVVLGPFGSVGTIDFDDLEVEFR